MQVTFEISEEELVELAKMVYLANFVVNVSSNPTFNSDNYKYEKLAVFESTKRTLNKMLLHYIPKKDMVEANELHDEIFTHTIALENSVSKLVNIYMHNTDLEMIASSLTKRDFYEQGGDTNDANLLKEGVYKILYYNNLKELKEYGLNRLRIVE